MKLLIVDDEPAVVEFLSNVAANFGDVEIESASSGEETLTRVIQGRYDMISLDIKMPGVSGVEVLSLLRNMCPHAVIVILSGFVTETEPPEIAGCADTIIQKPIAMEKFIAVLTCAQRIRHSLDELRNMGEIPLPS